MTADLGADDRAEILALLEAEIAGAPAARTLNPAGCLVFLAAAGAFLSLSVLTRRWELPAAVRTILFAVIVLTLIGGLAMIFLGGASGESRARAAATEALDHLATLSEASTPRQNLQAAVRLLWNANYSRGPWSVSTIDVDGARYRLGHAGVLPWILEIEQVLVGGQRVTPVFTPERQG